MNGFGVVGSANICRRVLMLAAFAFLVAACSEAGMGASGGGWRDASGDGGGDASHSVLDAGTSDAQVVPDAERRDATPVPTRPFQSDWSYRLRERAGSGFRLGCALALSQDQETLVVGSKDAFVVGAVFVYKKDGRDWVLAQTIQGPRGSAFGSAVAISRDARELYVAAGARTDEDIVVYRRGIYSYARAGSIQISQQAQLFVSSLSLSDDGLTMAVGDGGSPVRRSVAMILRKQNGRWLLTDLLQEPSGRAQFAVSVSLSGDGRTVVVGDPNVGAHGKAFVYQDGNGDWSLVQTINSLRNRGVGSFGAAVSFSAEHKTLLISDRDSVEIFQRANAAGPWAHIDNAAARRSDAFGGAILLSPDGQSLVTGQCASDYICFYSRL